MSERTTHHSAKSTKASNSRCPGPSGADQPAARDDRLDHPTRRHMISEAAYYLAERRYFEPGSDLADWAEAEQQVDAAIARP
jgi:hypothetical protein